MQQNIDPHKRHERRKVRDTDGNDIQDRVKALSTFETEHLNTHIIYIIIKL